MDNLNELEYINEELLSKDISKSASNITWPSDEGTGVSHGNSTITASSFLGFMQTSAGQFTCGLIIVLVLVFFLCIPLANEVRRVHGGVEGAGRTKLPRIFEVKDKKRSLLLL